MLIYKFSQSKVISLYKSLFSSMIIDAEFSIKDHGSIHRNCDRKRLEPLNVITDPNQIKLLVKARGGNRLGRARLCQA
jgi:hypothetical protein